VRSVEGTSGLQREDLWKRNVLRWKRKSEGVMDSESGEDETGKLT